MSQILSFFSVQIQISVFDSRVLCNKESRTPPGPEGSNGSDPLCVPQGARLSFFVKSRFFSLSMLTATVLE